MQPDRARPDGDLAEKLCQACLATVQCAMTTYWAARARWPSDGTHRLCTNCGRPTRYLRSVFAVRPMGPRWCHYDPTTHRLLFVAVVAGAYAALRLIDGQLIDSASPQPFVRILGRGRLFAYVERSSQGGGARTSGRLGGP